MKESSYRAGLIDRLSTNGCEVEAIESHATCPGIPDVWWHHIESRISGWIETKIVQPNGRIEFEPKQLPLIERWWKAGINVCVIAYDPKVKAAFLIRGNMARAAGKNFQEVVELRDALELSISNAALVRELVSLDQDYRERIREVR